MGKVAEKVVEISASNIGPGSARPGRPRLLDPDTEVQLILDASMSVMRRQGSTDVNVTEILQEARLSTRAFYRHFSSKDDLLRAMYRRETDRAASNLERRLAAIPSAVGKLEAWIDEHLSFVYDSRKVVRVALMSSEAALRAADVSERRAMRELMLTPLVRLLEQGRSDGEFPRADPATHALSIHAVIGGLLQAGVTGTPVWPTRGRAVAETMKFCTVALGVDLEALTRTAAVSASGSRRDG